MNVIRMNYTHCIVILLITRIYSLRVQYHTNDELEGFLKNFTELHSSISELSSIGKSVRGVDLWAIKLTASNDNLTVPHVKFIGNIHGNEAVGREILLQYIQFLGDNYKKNDTVTWLLENTIIHILPSMNPDGFDIANVGMCEGVYGRANSNGVDLNRNFPEFHNTNSLKPQPEMQAIQDWMSKVPFLLSASLHTGALVVNYPYDTYLFSGGMNMPSLTPDDDVFKYLALSYASNNPTMSTGENCGMSFENGITNGAEWYPLNGGMQDFNYQFYGCYELTLELSCCKYPLVRDLPQIWNDNKEALLNFSLQANTGIRGLIKNHANDSKKLRLKIIGRDINFFTTERGEFWRILLPGEYELQVFVNSTRNETIPFKIHSQSHPIFKSTFIEISIFENGKSVIIDGELQTVHTSTITQMANSTTGKPGTSTIIIPTVTASHFTQSNSLAICTKSEVILINLFIIFVNYFI